MVKSKRTLSSEALGDKGENVFKGLCIDAGLIATKSQPDIMGWDYLVEFPYPEADASASLDKRPHPTECKVQVKTVWSETKEIRLKLSAAEKLAKTPYPSFIAVLAIDSSLNVISLKFFHMIGKNLEFILKKLRSATLQSSLKINHTQIAFRIKDGIAVDVNAKALHLFLSGSCGNDLSEYRRIKQEQLESLGFGKLRYELSVNVNSIDELGVTKLLLGLREADIVSYKAHEVRFGIPLLDHAGGGGRIRVNPRPVDRCRMVINSFSHRMSVRLDVDLYLPPHRKTGEDVSFRISTPSMELFAYSQQLEVKSSLLEFFSNPKEVLDIIDALRLHQIMSAGGGHMSLYGRDKLVVKADFGFQQNDEYFSWISNILKLAQMFQGILVTASERSRGVRFEQVLDNADDVQLLSEIICNASKMTFKSITFKTNHLVQQPLPTEVLLIKRVPLGEFALAYYGLLTVNAKAFEEELRFEPQLFSLRDVTIINVDESSFQTYCDEARETTGISILFVAKPIRHASNAENSTSFLPREQS